MPEGWTPEQKREFARLLLSPLIASDEMLDRFVRECDSPESPAV